MPNPKWFLWKWLRLGTLWDSVEKKSVLSDFFFEITYLYLPMYENSKIDEGNKLLNSHTVHEMWCIEQHGSDLPNL